MSKEERAEISRTNGAKSKGPKTEAGKERSSRNALKHGERATKHSDFAPPHDAVLCTDDRQEFAERVTEWADKPGPCRA